MKKVLFNQPFGLGDILFCEPIAQHYIDNGYEVIWPVDDHYLWIKDYIPHVKFVRRSCYKIDYELCKKDGIVNSHSYIPLRFANPIVRNLAPHDYSDIYNCMLDKYRMLNLPIDKWKELKWLRNKSKEEALFNQLNLKDKKYNLVNSNFGASGSKITEIENAIDNNYPIITMNYLDGYTMLDWGMVVENAENIYTVSTSIVFLIEGLKTIAKEIHLFPRLPKERDLTPVKAFVNKNWILHEY